MEFPNRLDEWTFETIIALVQKYEYEPGLFDYKEALNATRPEHRNDHNASIRRTVCSMANADGGYILFGVRDRSLSASSPEDRIVGISVDIDLRKVFSDKLSLVQRSIYFEASQKPYLLPNNSKRGIFVAYIPQSPLRPHMDESTGNFYRRGEGGKAEIMKFYEVREQMMYTEERLRKVTLFRLKLTRYRKIALEMWQTAPATKIFYRFDTGAFEALLADICGLLPPSSSLLEQLLEIPIMATMVNEILARTITNSIQHSDIGNDITDLYNKCVECENQLNQIFGQLPENH